MVLCLLGLALEITLGDCDILLVGDISFLIIAVIAGHDSDALGVLLLPLPASLGEFPSALDGGFAWCCSATAGGYFHVAQDEGGPNRVLIRGVPCGDIK
jgi:hypothetical protein